MKRYFHLYDIPKNVLEKRFSIMSVDTEAMGLKIPRDRLCLVQVMLDESEVHLIHFPESIYNKSDNLKKLLSCKQEKIMHFARFDIGIIYKYLKIKMNNIICTRTLSKIGRTYTDRHGLKDGVREILKKDLSKGEQCSYWGCNSLTEGQIEYASGDVKHLPDLYCGLKNMIQRENREMVSKIICKCIPKFAILESKGLDPAFLLSD